ADSLASAANRVPRRATLFYATDDDKAAGTVERLIRAAGFDPLKAGPSADAGRLEGPDGDLSQGGLNGELVDLDQARDAIAARKVTACAQPKQPPMSRTCRTTHRSPARRSAPR